MLSVWADRWFPATVWSDVDRVRGKGPEAEQVLNELCKRYWKPLWWFAQRKGKTAEEAEDVVQGFFGDFLPKGGFGEAVRGKGKLRTFLMACCENYIAGEWRKENAGKRRVRKFAVPYEEEQHAQEDSLTPDAAYDRKWALELLQQVLEHLRVTWTGPDRAREQKVLGPLLLQRRTEHGAVKEAALALGMNRGTLKSKLCRLRELRDVLLMEKVRETMLPDATEKEVLDEYREIESLLW